MAAVGRILSEGGIFTGLPIMHEILSHFFVQVVIIIVMCRGLAIISRPLKQPLVIFEIIGGILLGPSALGRDEHYLGLYFSKMSQSYLSLVSSIGLVLYLFIVGMELDPKLLFRNGKQAAAIAVSGMAVPFALGVAISPVLFHNLQSDDPEYKDSNKTAFFVFVGTAMSITAFPVLARILKEDGLIYTKAGAMTMGAAAINDALAWSLLTLAISIANSSDMGVAGYVVGCVLAFACGLFFILKVPFEMFVRYIEAWNSPFWDQNLFAFTLIILFLSAWTTSLLGVHSIFGAFLFGIIVPRQTRLFHACNEYLEQFVVTILLPIYFTLSGLNTDITQIKTPKQGNMVLLVCFIATIGKLIGCSGAALVTGMSVRESSVVGALMNTRGLVELIVLNLGKEYMILNTRTFSVMVLMCLFTTFTTSPLVNLIFPKSVRELEKDKESEKSHESEVALAKVEGLTDYQDLKLCVTIDQLSRMQGMMQVMSLFAPANLESNLSVTAVKFMEPTHTSKDEYLGLGRLVKVEEEAITAEMAFREESTNVKPYLLPLSMQCQSIGIPVSAFQIFGDPHEFPVELRTLVSIHGCNLVMIPIRTSEYWQRFVWHSLRRLPVSTAIISQSQVNSEELNLAHQDGDHSNANSSSGAAAAAYSGQADSSSKTDGIVSRIRRYTISDEREGMGIDQVNSRFIRSNKTSTSVRRIMGVITGSLSDVTILTILTRLAERPDLQIAVMIAKADSFEPTLLGAISDFRSTVKSPNVSIVPIDVEGDNFEGVHAKVASCLADLVLVGMTFPSPAEFAAIQTAAAMQSDNNSAPSASSRSARASFSGISMINLGDQHHTAETLNQIGVPENLRLPVIEHPELGYLGSLLNKSGNFPFLMVIHHHLDHHHLHAHRPTIEHSQSRSFVKEDYSSSPSPRDDKVDLTDKQDQEKNDDTDNSNDPTELKAVEISNGDYVALEQSPAQDEV